MTDSAYEQLARSDKILFPDGNPTGAAHDDIVGRSVDLESATYPTSPYTFTTKRIDPSTGEPMARTIDVSFTPDEMGAIALARELQSGDDSPIAEGAIKGSGIERDFLVDLRLPWSQILTDREKSLQMIRNTYKYAVDAVTQINTGPQHDPRLLSTFEAIIEALQPLVTIEVEEPQ